MGLDVLYMKMLNNSYLSSYMIRIVGYGIAVSHVEECFASLRFAKSWNGKRQFGGDLNGCLWRRIISINEIFLAHKAEKPFLRL